MTNPENAIDMPDVIYATDFEGSKLWEECTSVFLPLITPIRYIRADLFPAIISMEEKRISAYCALNKLSNSALSLSRLSLIELQECVETIRSALLGE